MKEKIPDIYGHFLGTSSRPRITISTHYLNEKQILYIGGEVSESGVRLSDEDQKIQIDKFLREALSWIDLDIERIDVLRINRAETKNNKVLKPDSFFIGRKKGLMVCWPTKLAFAPLIAESILNQMNPSKLRKRNIKRMRLDKPHISKYPWEAN